MNGIFSLFLIHKFYSLKFFHSFFQFFIFALSLVSFTMASPEAKPSTLGLAPLVAPAVVTSASYQSVVKNVAAPLVAAPAITAPYVASPYVASPYVASPYVASPYVASPYVASPYVAAL